MVSTRVSHRVVVKERTVGVGKSDGQGNSLGLALADIGGGVPHPAAVGADVGGELHLGNDCDRLDMAPPCSELAQSIP